MARDYGFNVRFGADITELNDGLKTVQKSLSSSISTLKELDKASKLDPSNVKLYTAKQAELEKQLKATGEKLQTLKSKKEEIDKLYADGKITTKDWAEYQTQLKKTQTEFDELKKKTDQYSPSVEAVKGKLSGLKTELQDLGKKVTSVGGSLTKGLTAPIASIGTASMAAWKEIDDAYDNIILKTGAVGESQEELFAVFDNVYSGISSSSNDVSEAIGEVNTRFHLTGKELESVSTYMLKYSEIAGQDVTESVINAAKIQEQWNLSMDDTMNALGMVAKKAQDTGISADTLTQAVTENASVFKEMGLTVSEAIDLMAQFEKNGLEAEDMLTGLKKAANNYAKHGKTMGEGLSDLVKRLQDTTTYQEAYNEVVELFGAKSALSFATAAQEGKINLSDLEGSLGSYSGVVSETFEATQDPIDKAQQAYHDLQLAGEALGSALQEKLSPQIETVSGCIGDMTDWLKQLDDQQMNTLVTVGLVLALIGPVVGLIGGVIGALGTVVGWISTLVGWIGSAIGIIGTIGSVIVGFIGAPLALLIGAIAAVVGAFVLLYTKCEWFRDGFNNIMQGIVDFGVGSWNGLCDAVNGVIDWFVGIPGYFQEIKDGIGSAWDQMIEKNKTTWSDMTSAVSQNLSGMWSSAVQFAGDIFNSVTGTFSSLWGTVSGIFGGIYDAVVTPISNAKSTVGGIIDTIKNFFNFRISWPHIPMPHFGISPYGWKVGDLLWGSIPSLSISWYGKAMKRPYVLDGATIFGMAGGKLLGGGEKGREIVTSEDDYLSRGNVTNNITIVQRDGEDAEALAKRVARIITDDMEYQYA